MQASVLEDVGKVLDWIVAHMKRVCARRHISTVDIERTWHAARIEDGGRNVVWHL
jgi:hypothetical protein